MPQNSTPVLGESNTSRTQLILNTSQLSGQDLSDYLSICEEVERLRLSHHQRAKRTNSMKATMTREEIFECSTINDDEFLSALEHQNTYVAPKVFDKLDISQSIEDMLKYFDEDVSISTKSNRSTPTSLNTMGKVAAVVASFSKKCEETTSKPTIRGKIPPSPQRCSIKELRAKYEAASQPKSNEICKIQTPPALKAPALMAAVNMKPSKTKVPETEKPSPSKSPSSKKSKVKKIAQMFNSKISQLVHRNSTEGGHYEPLNNEHSPDVKAKSPTPPPVPKPRQLRSTAQNVKPPTFCIRSPKASPRLRRRASLKAKGGSSKCLIAEDAFSQLSVRDKVLLYTKFIEDMSQKNPKFSKHAEILESNVRKQFARGEVVNEKQESVKHLKDELEARCPFPKQTISPKGLMRMQSVNDITYSVNLEAAKHQNSLEDNVYYAECVQIGEEKEEDVHPLHVSSLTVRLKPSPQRKLNLSSPTGRRNPLTRSMRNQRLLNHLNLFEPSKKRNNASIRSSHLSTELYAPPKKIRRTRSERLNPEQFFQNTDLERLFFSWIKERSGVDFDIAHSDNEQKVVKIVNTEGEKSIGSTSEISQKSAVERLLEEAIAKLENTISNQSKELANIIEENSKQNSLADNAPLEPTKPATPKQVINKTKRKTKAPAPPVPTQSFTYSTATSSGKQSEIECEAESPLPETQKIVPPVPAPRKMSLSTAPCSAISSAKQSDMDSESGVSTLPKVQSDESQPEQDQNKVTKNAATEFTEFIKPQNPPRRKKTRRNTSWKNDASTNEINLPADTILTTTTDDSESEYKVKALKKSSSPPNPKCKQRGHHIKKLCFRTLKAITSKQTKAVKSKSEQTPTKLSKKFLRVMNSPRRIKSAYTLTVLSSPSPYTDSDHGEPCSSRETSRSWPVTQPMTARNDAMNDRPASADTSLRARFPEPRPLSDSYIDQGFETGTNSTDSPVRPSRLNGVQPISPLFFCLNGEMERSSLSSRRSSYGLRSLYSVGNNKGDPSNCSTPVKGHVQKSFISPAIAQQQDFSPIQTSLKAQQRRRSLYEAESRRSSIAMQVIREDQPFDPNEPPPFTPDSLNANESAFFANAPTLDMPSQFDFNMEKQYSTYWIIVDDYTIAIKIFYNTTDRLRLLYDIFSQKNVDYRKLHFGIDDHKFTPYDPKDNFQSISTRLPPAKDSSHYWFSTGDLAVPFNGKYMPGKKVRRLFNFIYTCFEPNSVLRFGVDNFEFTHPRERLSTTMKLSMESSYSQLVGLQSGSSNGLEGRSRFAWPNPLCNILNANNAKTSDLDQSDLDSSSFCSTDLRYRSCSLSNSPISSPNSTPRNSEDARSPDIYDHIYENDSLAQVLKDAQQYNLCKSQIGDESMSEQKAMTIPELLEILQNQQQKLKSVEERISAYTNRANLSNAAFEHFKESPEYVRKLRNIIKVIDNIGRDNGFKACSLQQLESFMFFLSRYADLCLAKCSDHMNQILDTLMEQQRPVEV